MTRHMTTTTSTMLAMMTNSGRISFLFIFIMYIYLNF